MLNARIDVDTSSSPYKVNRNMPTLLEQYLTGKNDWMIFCDRIDNLLVFFEEVKATWMVLGVIATALFLGLAVGIICTFALVKDDQSLLSLLAGCLFAACFFVFAGYFCLMQMLVVKPLDDFAERVDAYCAEIAEAKATNDVQFRFERSGKCALFWDSDFKAWINVATTNAVDLTR